MDIYFLMCEIVDSWVLLVMFVFFLGVGVWVFWFSQWVNCQDVVEILFCNEICDFKLEDVFYV